MAGGDEKPGENVVSSELMTFATRVLERALQKAGYMPESPTEPGEMPNPGDMFIDAMATKLIALVNRADATVIPHLQSAIMSPTLDRLSVRNQRVARALGACTCFGEDVACEECGGRGAPGWRLPDRQLFEAVVRPALHKVSQYRLSARNGHVHSLQR